MKKALYEDVVCQDKFNEWTITEVVGLCVFNSGIDIEKYQRLEDFRHSLVNWEQECKKLKPKEENVKTIIEFRVGMTSCVGIHADKYPLSFGNYCSIGGLGNEYYCCNMWAENVTEFSRLHPDIKNVEVKIFGNICYVIDNRIPVKWRNSFCLTGSGASSAEDLRNLLAFSKQPITEHIRR